MDNTIAIDRDRSVSFSGYRLSKIKLSIKDITSIEEIKSSLKESILQLYRRGYTTFITGGADGFDLMAAEAVAELKANHEDIKLVVIVPFRGQERGYSESDKELYNNILERADTIQTLSEVYHKRTYLIRNDLMLKLSSVLICYFDGVRGGTMYTVNRAKGLNFEIINLAPNAPKSLTTESQQSLF